VLASLSFLAYIVGALLTIPLEGRIGYLLRGAGSRTRNGDLLLSLRNRRRNRGPVPRSVSPPREGHAGDAASFAADDFLDEIRTRYAQKPLSPASFRAPDFDVLYPDSNVLRPRLLTSPNAKSEVYAEYDRFTAEATFRINLIPPVFAYGALMTVLVHWTFAVVALFVAFSFLYQGTARITAAFATLISAAAAGLYRHPYEEYLIEMFGPVASSSDPREPGRE
jgi:hypothetical protein